MGHGHDVADKRVGVVLVQPHRQHQLLKVVREILQRVRLPHLARTGDCDDNGTKQGVKEVMDEMN